MIITCEKCYAKFNLDENLLKQTGSKVRCSKCQNIFLAYPPVEMERPVEPAEVSEEEARGTLETEEEALDLADLNLEAEMELKPEVEEEPEELLGLELETEPVAEETPEEAEAVLEIEEEELDLLDTEKMLDIEEEPEPETGVKEEPEE
ncbi:MAG: zinc-ribbon domain-containing protein, partial [Desulfobacterales bacterium]|nr:zinc-ribbon domain-containing protein [Desulfobacterales bacterium]